MSYYTLDMPYWLNMPMRMPAGAGMMQPYPSIQMIPGMGPLPSGIPTGPAPAPIPSAQDTGIGPAPETVQSTQYVAGYLKTQIGKKVRVEFLIGSGGPLVDRIGTLVGVGASYILIRPIETDDIMLCDLYSIKFVSFYA